MTAFCKILVGKPPQGRDHSEYLGIDESLILKWI
jgi:hypothetical protein